MSGSKKLLFVAAALAMFGVVMNLGLGSKPAQAGGGAPVMVLNTPLPVAQGTAWNVSVNNTPGVNIANTPSVSITGTPTVQLANSTDALGRPFAADLSIFDNQWHNITGFTISQGQIWMIEFASGDCGLIGGTSAATFVDGINLSLPLGNSGTGAQLIPFSTELSAAAGTKAHFAFAQQTRLYTDSTNDITKSVQIYGSTGEGGGLNCQIHLTGRLISTQ